MARKKSRRQPSTRLWMLIWTMITAVSGGGLGGYFNPDLPILGPLFHSWRAGEDIDARNVALRALDSYLDQSAGNAGSGYPATNSQKTGSPQATPNGGPPPYGTWVAPQATLASSQQANRSKLLIATFNIQVFGVSKLAKPVVVDILARVVRQFDIVAIQEIRAQEDDILPRFLAAVNADGSRYDFVIGPRLGRTVSTEQYAFIFDASRVEYEPSSVGTLSDPYDTLHREPLASRFRVRTNPPQQAFTFWLVNIHTDPDEVPQEISALADAFQVMQVANPAEDDVILLGDLNANESQLGRLAQIPGMRWVVGGNAMTNTRGNRAYDNLLFQGEKTAEFTGRWGVINLEAAFGITRELALQVSDHLPVWAEFEAFEAPPISTALQPVTQIR